MGCATQYQSLRYSSFKINNAMTASLELETRRLSASELDSSQMSKFDQAIHFIDFHRSDSANPPRPKALAYQLGQR